jgi:hypothetical protein
MCMPTGKADLMSPQARYRYEEAVGGLEIPKAPQVVARDDTYVAPKGATVKLADGRMVSKESFAKLQQKLKDRGG